jgi:hypothetical protein
VVLLPCRCRLLLRAQASIPPSTLARPLLLLLLLLPPLPSAVLLLLAWCAAEAGAA